MERLGSGLLSHWGGKKSQPCPRLAFNAHVGEIGMVNPREVNWHLHNNAPVKSGSATAATIQEDPQVGFEAFVSIVLPILRFVARATVCLEYGPAYATASTMLPEVGRISWRHICWGVTREVGDS